jgi:hypothetical protein
MVRRIQAWAASRPKASPGSLVFLVPSGLFPRPPEHAECEQALATGMPCPALCPSCCYRVRPLSDHRES